MSIVVQRSGVTARHYNFEDTKASLKEGGMPGNPSDRAVKLHFTMASKGGGDTDVLVSISHSNFGDLAQLMFEANPDAAIRAFGLAMQNGID